MGPPRARTELIWMVSAFCGLCAAPLRAAEMPPAWRNLQSLEVEKPGLVRIAVPLETLTECRSGLEDLRLYDAEGREMPYGLERPVEPQVAPKSPQKFHVTVSPEATVVELTTGSAQSISGVTLETPSTDLLKAVRIEGSSDATAWNVLAQGELVFRQPNGASRLHVPIASGVWPFLKLSLDDRRTAPIPITGAQLHTEAGPPAPSEPLGIEITRRTEEPAQTRLELRLAGANCVLAGLTLAATDPLFSRPVTLSEQQYAANEIRDTVLSRGTVYRIALEGQPAASSPSFAVDVPVHSRDLLLSIENGDNAPLTLSGITGRCRPVYLTFLASQPGTYYLLSGNTQCPAPRYDLAALAPNLKGATLLGVSPGPRRANPAFQSGEELAGIESPGTPLDVSSWTYRKAVRPGQGRVQQFELDLEVLAHAAASLQDLRVISGGKQVPYVLERTALTRSFLPQMTADDDPKQPKTSRWKITLPQHPLPVGKLTFAVPGAYFKRQVTLSEEVPDPRGNLCPRTLASGTWLRRPEQKESTLSLQLASPPLSAVLMLEIQNGDNPALDLREPAAWYPVTRVLLVAPLEAQLHLYYGNPKAHAPQYDLELAVPRMLAAQKHSATPGPEELLKPASGGISAGTAGWLFRAVLGMVVVVLLLVIAKLLPKPREKQP